MVVKKRNWLWARKREGGREGGERESTRETMNMNEHSAFYSFQGKGLQSLLFL
jgi:hypothetical protein